MFLLNLTRESSIGWKAPLLIIGNTIRSCAQAVRSPLCREVRRNFGGVRIPSGQRHSRGYSLTGVYVVTGTLCGAGLVYYLKEKVSVLKFLKENPLKNIEAKQTELPSFGCITMEEVAKHKTQETGVWLTYKNGVYDVTDYIERHPGGERMIMLAAGARLDPYWNVYGFHKKKFILKQLKEYRIGNLIEEDRVHDEDDKDPYRNDPVRHPALIAYSNLPFVAETPLELLQYSYITPNELFFVRNHLPVPNIKKDEYQLHISADGIKTKIISLDVLKKNFKKHTITVTTQCAGNRCDEMNSLVGNKFCGLVGGAGYISTARWGGALLRDVLNSAGLDDDIIETSDFQHLHLEGQDTDIAGTKYEVSIPIYTATLPRGDVLLAYEMNGVDIPRDHGYPVRCIVPGTVGARNVKWIGKVTASREESPSHWQQFAYKGYPPNVDLNSVDASSIPAIQELPVTSVICYPKQGARLCRDEEEITISGYAWSGGGRGIYRVDLSLDGGKTWSGTTVDGNKQAPGRSWAWSFWEATVPIPAHTDKLEIVCKAVDSSYNVQPENTGPIWNFRGYLSTAWHRVKVVLYDTEDSQ